MNTNMKRQSIDPYDLKSNNTHNIFRFPSDDLNDLNGLKRNRLSLFDINIDNLSLEEAAHSLCLSAQSTTPDCAAFINADCVNQFYGNHPYKKCVQTFNWVFGDGIGIRLAAKMQGMTFRDNVNGTDLFPVLLNKLDTANLRVFLLGGQDQTAAKVAARIHQEHANINIVGHHHGFLNSQSSKHVQALIKNTRPDVLFVAMGAPHQELWIQQHANKLQIPLAIGVGGLFDFYSGQVSRAPLVIRKMNLEWVWRLAVQPKDKAKRYLIGNPLFLMRAWREALAKKTKPSLALSTRIRRTAIRFNTLFNLWLKRSIDMIAASLGMLVLSPLLISTAIAIKLDSPGSILFKQPRVGKFGKLFPMYKFRSMTTDASVIRESMDDLNDIESGVLFKLKQDPRITHVGRFIRKYSIDELPQLWNVLIGDMSLVGPRPPLPSEVQQYQNHDLYRLKCKPGITCIWQVSGRSDISFKQQVGLDIDYITKKSVWVDLKILFQTIPAVIFARGAY